MFQTPARPDSLTHQLALVSEISSRAAAILQLDELLQTVSDLTKAQFNLYHVHIYLLDPADQVLTLAAGAGDIGRMMVRFKHQILMNNSQSMVARSARDMQAVIINNVVEAEHFLPNPLLPDTRSEMAVPMLFAGNPVGVLDIQADAVGRFDESDAYIFTLLANQIGVAVQNAYTFDQLRQREVELRRANKHAQDLTFGLEQSAIVAITDQRGIIEYVNDKFCEISQYSREELIGQDHRIINSGYHDKAFIRDLWVTIANGKVWHGELKNRSKDGSFYWVDTTIIPFLNEEGKPRQYIAIRFDITARKMIEQQSALRASELQSVAEISHTIGQLVDDLDQLLVAVSDQTKTRFELYHTHIYLHDETRNALVLSGGAGEVGRIMKSQNRTIRADSKTSIVARAYQLNQGVIVNDVASSPDFLPNPLLPDTRSEMAVPMTVSGRVVGVLDVQASVRDRFTQDEMNILTTLAGEIAVAVINARAFETLRASEAEVARRALELETVAQVTADVSTNLNLSELLNSVVELSKQRFGLYHSHIYLIDEHMQYLTLTAGAGEAGKSMMARGHRISYNHPHSLVARAARTRSAIISNDVTKEPDFLPNPFLPETQSEMAVPMLIGNALVGVLDVQASVTNRFDEHDMQIKTMLGAQIAVAIQNANMYQKQVEAVEQLREVDRLKSEFLASMSHELRTPLNSIIGYSQLMIDGVDGEMPEEAIEDLQAIHSSGHHLLSIINDILDLAKIEAGRMEMDLQPAQFRPIADEVYRMTNVLVQNKPVEMRLDVPKDLPKIWGDTVRIRQILYNLVSNAIKFTQQGEVRIAAKLSDDNEMVHVSVSDTGTGIPSDHLERIFNKFHQVDNSATRKVGGTGLGLTITRYLVEMHGGKIWVESEEGKGSTFHFTLMTTE